MIMIAKKDSGYINKDIREDDELWCLHCYDVFPAHQLKVDRLGYRTGCGSTKYPDCDGAGLGIDIKDANSDFAVSCRKSAAEEAERQASMTDEEKRKEIIDRWRDFYSRIVNEDRIDWSSKKVAKHIARYDELSDAQHGVDTIQKTTERFLKFIKGEGDCFFTRGLIVEFCNNPPPAWKEKYKGDLNKFLLEMLDEKREAEEKSRAHLEELLAKKSYRNSFHFVMSDLFDKEKLEKSKKRSHQETYETLTESVRQAEDIYNLGRRLHGSAYGGKRQK